MSCLEHYWGLLGFLYYDKVGNRMFYMKEVGTQKDIFLKTLSNHLFNSFDGRYTPANTLVINDSPIKHMLNLLENVVLLPTWSYEVMVLLRTQF